VFDLDGTLVDSSRDIAEAVDAAIARVAPGTAPLGVEQVRSFVGSGARVLIERSLRASGLAARLEVEGVLAVFMECYAARLTATTRLYPGAAAALDALAHLPLAVLTNKPGPLSRRLLDELQIADRFALVVGGGDLATKKPDPAGLLWIGPRGGDAHGRAPRRVRPGRCRVRVPRPPAGRPLRAPGPVVGALRSRVALVRAVGSAVRVPGPRLLSDLGDLG